MLFALAPVLGAGVVRVAYDSHGQLPALVVAMCVPAAVAALLTTRVRVRQLALLALVCANLVPAVCLAWVSGTAVVSGRSAVPGLVVVALFTVPLALYWAQHPAAPTTRRR